MSWPEDVGVVVLAGGGGRRMGGRDKGSLTLGGETFLKRIVSRFYDAGCRELLLSVDRAGRYDLSGMTIFEVVDSLTDAGPLGGIAAALRACRSRLLLAVAVDMPWVTPDVAGYLASSLEEGDRAAVAVDSGGRLHPLCALYSREALPALQRLLETGERRLTKALEAVGARQAALTLGGFGDIVVTNVNTPDEYSSVRRQVEGPPVIAVCGVKNSGKTTLLEKLLPVLRGRGFRVGVVKHDGHDFTPDVPGTDSFRLRQAGADVVGVYSDARYMVTGMTGGLFGQDSFVQWFRDVDLVLHEGGKRSAFPKFEVVRDVNGNGMTAQGGAVLGVCTDVPGLAVPEGVPVFGLDDIEAIVDAMETACGIHWAGR